MEFGNSSPMFLILATLSLLNLFCFVGKVTKMGFGKDITVLEPLLLQILLCGVFVSLNLPVYEGLFFRRDNGRIPTVVTLKATILASACLVIWHLYL